MKTGRPLNFDPDEALENAMHLFWRQGYSATSLQDICKVTGLSKSSLYGFFESKHRLFERCIERYAEILTSELSQKKKRAKTGMLFLQESFMSIADETVDPIARRGCLVINSASEFSQTDPVVASLVRQTTDNLTQIFKSAIEQAQQDGNILKSKDSKALAKYLMTSMAGLQVMVKAGANRKDILETVDVVLAGL